MKLLNKLVHNDGVVDTYSTHFLCTFGLVLAFGVVLNILGLAGVIISGLFSALIALLTYRTDKRINGTPKSE